MRTDGNHKMIFSYRFPVRNLYKKKGRGKIGSTFSISQHQTTEKNQRNPCNAYDTKNYF